MFRRLSDPAPLLFMIMITASERTFKGKLESLKPQRHCDFAMMTQNSTRPYLTRWWGRHVTSPTSHTVKTPNIQDHVPEYCHWHLHCCEVLWLFLLMHLPLTVCLPDRCCHDSRPAVTVWSFTDGLDTDGAFDTSTLSVDVTSLWLPPGFISVAAGAPSGSEITHNTII